MTIEELYTFVNARGEEMTGQHREEWVGFTDAALALFRSGEDFVALVAQLLKAQDAHWTENGF